MDLVCSRAGVHLFMLGIMQSIDELYLSRVDNYVSIYKIFSVV